jgi:2-oxoglutarate dehydrogenase E1 component
MNDDPDHLPGNSPAERQQMLATFESLATQNAQGKMVLRKGDLAPVLEQMGYTTGKDEMQAVDLVWNEMGLDEAGQLTQTMWIEIMKTFLRRHHEAKANMIVVNCTTPAQYFHVLRRQLNQSISKPLVVMSPKYLLHHTPCTSALEDFAPGSYFNRIIDDNKVSDNTRHQSKNPTTGESYLLPPESIRRILVCSGQVYYQLSRIRRAKKRKDIVLVRLEQIAPFPHDRITRVLTNYPNAEIVWVQEEPKNMGAWPYVAPRLRTSLRQHCQDRGRSGQDVRNIKYVGRAVSASPATASNTIHMKETKDVLERAFSDHDFPSE